MSNTDTVDILGTAKQCIELAKAGSDMVRITVNIPEAAAAVPQIKRRMLDAEAQALGHAPNAALDRAGLKARTREALDPGWLTICVNRPQPVEMPEKPLRLPPCSSRP